MSLTIIILGIVILSVLSFLTYFKIFRKPKKLQRIWQQIQAGDTRNSMRNLRTLIIKQGGSIDAHFLLAECYRREGNYSMAVVEYRYCIKIRRKPYLTSQKEIREGLANCYIKLGKEDEALAELFELQREDPKNHRYLFNIAKIFYDRGNLEQAVTYFDKTIKYNPTHAQSLGYIGIIMYHANNVRDAMTYLSRAVRYDPQNYQAYYYLGRLYADGRDFTKALTYFEASQRASEFKVRAFLQKGNCHKEMGEFESAVDEYKKGISSATGRDQRALLAIKYALAELYESHGKLAEAIEQWEGIGRIDSTYRDVEKKLDQYQDLRADDNMKDFLTSSIPVFETICLDIVRHLGYDVIDIGHVKSSITNIIAAPRLNVMRSVNRQYIYFKIYRDAVSLGLNAIKNLLEEAKKVRCIKAVCISPFKFRPEAVEFALPRQIDLIGGNQLSKILREIRGI